MTASVRSRTPALDVRSPLVLDLRELGRRPGAMRQVRTQFDAPDGWELELVRVPRGATAELDVRLESVMDGVLVTAAVRAPIAAECGRCLTPIEDTVEADLQELFAYEPPEAADDEAELPLVDGDYLDLRDVVRDAVVLALPLNPVCAEDCEGLCSGCGVAWSTLPADHNHDTIDPRWASLADVETTKTES